MKEITINCAGIDSPRELHRLLAKELNFPEWYGHNLDALHDCLTSITEETTLCVLHLSANGFRRVLMDSERDNPKLHITL